MRYNYILSVRNDLKNKSDTFDYVLHIRVHVGAIIFFFKSHKFVKLFKIGKDTLIQ